MLSGTGWCGVGSLVDSTAKQKIVKKTATAVSHAAKSDSHHGRFASRQIRNTADSQTAGTPPLANPTLANPSSVNPPSANPPSVNPPFPPPTLRAWAAGMLVQSSPLDVGFSGGMAMLRVGGQTDASPAVAVRLGTQSSELRDQRWGLEIGSILPHGVSGGFNAVNQPQGSTVYDAHLDSFFEVHTAAIHALPHGNEEWAIPEIGLGLSFMNAINRIHSATTYSGVYSFSNGQQTAYSYQIQQTATDRRWSVSPLVRLGVVFFPGPSSLYASMRRTSITPTPPKDSGRRLIWGCPG